MVLHRPCSQTTLTHADKVSSITQPFQLARWMHQTHGADTCLCPKHRSATSMLICASILLCILGEYKNVLFKFSCVNAFISAPAAVFGFLPHLPLVFSTCQPHIINELVWVMFAFWLFFGPGLDSSMSIHHPPPKLMLHVCVYVYCKRTVGFQHYFHPGHRE